MLSIAKKLTKSDNSFYNVANAVAIGSVAVGCIALILSLSILNGFDLELKNTARKFTADISVQTINHTKITNTKQKIETINNIENINTITPIIQAETIINTKNNTDGVIIKSITQTSNILIVDGNKEFNNTNYEIVISETLAQKLQANIGTKLLLYAVKDKELLDFNSITYAPFTIIGLYKTGMQMYDNNVIFADFEVLKEFLEYDDNTTSMLEITLHNINNANETATQIETSLGYPIFALTYYDINAPLFA